MIIRLILAVGVAALSVAACSPANDAEKDAMSAESSAADTAAMAPADGSMSPGGAMASSDGSMTPGTTQPAPGSMPNNPPPVDGSMPQTTDPSSGRMTPPPA